MENVSNFAALDYGVLAIMLLVSIFIGIYASLKGNKSPEEFLVGNRSFGALPVGMSLLTSFISSVSLLGFSGEAYAHGTQISLFVLGTVMGIIAVGFVILPVTYPLKLTSVNEYIQLRFKSPSLHAFISFLTCFQGILFMGVCLYAPTIALSTVTDISYLTYIFLLGSVCTLYSSFGGIRAVVWTDVFQLSAMILGLVVVDIVGCIQAGGLARTWSVALEGGRLDVVKYAEKETHTIYARTEGNVKFEYRRTIRFI